MARLLSCTGRSFAGPRWVGVRGACAAARLLSTGAAPMAGRQHPPPYLRPRSRQQARQGRCAPRPHKLGEQGCGQTINPHPTPHPLASRSSWQTAQGPKKQWVAKSPQHSPWGRSCRRGGGGRVAGGRQAGSTDVSVLRPVSAAGRSLPLGWQARMQQLGCQAPPAPPLALTYFARRSFLHNRRKYARNGSRRY